MIDDERSPAPVLPDAPGVAPAPEAAPRPAEAPAPKRRRRWWRYVALGVPLATVAAAGLVVGAYIYLLTQIAAGPGETGARRPQAQLFAWPLRLADRVNILIIGIDVTLDNRRRVVNISRADTLILLSVDPVRRRIAAISLPRDTRAQIPGIGENKINASYAYGGPRLTIRTVEQLMAVKVHYYVKLGPESFKRLIDAIGGLEVDVQKDMKYTDTWAGLDIDLKKGRQKLTGDQVAGYIRFRHDALGDIGRVERQRQVMNTLIQELRQPAAALHGPSLLRAFAQNTETDLSATELMSLGLFAIRSHATMQEFTLPGTFAPLYWEPDFAKIRPMVADLFYGLSADDLASTAIEVQNASGTPGLARQAAARLQEVGFRSVKVLTAPAAADATTVISRMPSPAAARLAAAALGRAILKHEPGTAGAPITILVAKDATSREAGALRRTNGSQ